MKRLATSAVARWLCCRRFRAPESGQMRRAIAYGGQETVVKDQEACRWPLEVQGQLRRLLRVGYSTD